MLNKSIKLILARLLAPIIEESLDRDSKNIERSRRRQAASESAQLVDRHMKGVPSFSDAFDLLEHSVAEIDRKTKDPALICEFGVASGKTINFIGQLFPDHTIYGFDSFEGLPENWRDGFAKGAFKTEAPPKVRPNVRLIQGHFQDSLGPFLEKHPQGAAFMHIDCDLYSSTKTVLENFHSRIMIGTIIVFDEYFNYPEWREGEYKAFAEYIERSDFSFEYIGYCRYHQQVALKIV
jgi:hypothetical protein